jgi:putative DNA methylase
MLQALLDEGLGVVGTWPVHGTGSTRQRSQSSNTLATYVLLVCRPRDENAPLGTRREFYAVLRDELRSALPPLTSAGIAAVDLAQAALGPGIAAFSRFAKVLEADGSFMTVRTALQLVNQALDEILAEHESDYDPDTRWAITWFEQVGMQSAKYGVAETLSKAKNTSVEGLIRAGIVEAKAGNVRLLHRKEMPSDWDPAADKRPTVWEMVQHLVGRLESSEEEAAALVRRLGGHADTARDLAYRLFLICDRKKWAQESQEYNGLVVAWPEVARLAAQSADVEVQGGLF